MQPLRWMLSLDRIQPSPSTSNPRICTTNACITRRGCCTGSRPRRCVIFRCIDRRVRKPLPCTSTQKVIERSTWRGPNSSHRSLSHFRHMRIIPIFLLLFKTVTGRRVIFGMHILSEMSSEKGRRLRDEWHLQTHVHVLRRCRVVKVEAHLSAG